jgi:beta-glucanase (GH16 family)
MRSSTGRTLAYAEEFDRPLSLSRNGIGADYAAAKPTYWGDQDFGGAVFPYPDWGFDNVRVVDDRYLRIDVAPAPPGFVDPQGWGRKHLGGLLASARQGGSGFSAQYGYFEARMLAPAVPGTWPAFWTLPSDNLDAPTPVEAEFDAVELYGHDPRKVCQSTHAHRSDQDAHGSDQDDGIAHCVQHFATERAALSWHTYGVSVLPTGITFYVDGRVTATAPQVEGGDAPMFFLVDLALGGGWPIDLRSVQDRAALYVDYVRVDV